MSWSQVTWLLLHPSWDLQLVGLFQGLKWGWITSGPWVDRTASRTLLSTAEAGTSVYFRVCDWVCRQCLLPGMWTDLAPPGPWEGSYWVTSWVFVQAGWLQTFGARGWK